MSKTKHGLWAALVVVALVSGYFLGARFPHAVLDSRHPTSSRVPRFRLALPNLAGHMRSLSHWPAKVYLVNFWAPWCGPCRAEIPLLIRIAQQDKRRGLVVVGIALDRKKSVARFIHNHHVTYPVVLGGSQGLAMLAEFGDMQGAIPFSLFVGPHGRILTGRLGTFSPRALQAGIAYAFKRR